MEEAEVLLATLVQAAAAVVAIIGGFLVSRLVAISSEREGLRRQRATAKAHLNTVAADYEAAHADRFENSKDDFEGWVLDDVVGGQRDEDPLLRDNIPRGSSEDEMRPVLRDLISRVEGANAAIRAVLRQSDDNRVDLDDLIGRGLVVTAADRDIFESVMYRIRSAELPVPRISGIALATTPIMPPISIDPGGTSARRLDESIRDEQNLLSRRVGLEQEIDRLSSEIENIGRPVGVSSAIAILSIYSLLGIALPLIVMVTHPRGLPSWGEWLLLIGFLVGLASVLGYIYWYARNLNDPDAEDKEH